MRVVLTGFMGAGKTTVGSEVARRLGWPFVDLDERIEAQAGCTVREIFERFGEPRFRELEQQALAQAMELDPVVLATGGGTLTRPATLEAVRGGSVIVWLHPAFATIVRRVGGRGKESRPMFHDEAAALALYRERLPAYATADLTIDVGEAESMPEVASRIVMRLQERGCSI